MKQMGIAPRNLCMVKQVHGTAVHIATAPSSGPSATEADALVCDRPGLAIGVLSADCAPVLAVDPEAGVVGAAHAGWRGALAGVIEAMIQGMVDLGARPSRIAAAIGPCIAKTSYEVGPDMRAAFERDDLKGVALFEPIAGGDRYLFDLKTYSLLRLARADVTNHMALPEDTLTDEARFFSARRSRNRGEERFGLLLSAIALKG
jgi:YfiH family protein